MCRMCGIVLESQVWIASTSAPLRSFAHLHLSFVCSPNRHICLPPFTFLSQQQYHVCVHVSVCVCVWQPQSVVDSLIIPFSTVSFTAPLMTTDVTDTPPHPSFFLSGVFALKTEQKLSFPCFCSWATARDIDFILGRHSEAGNFTSLLMEKRGREQG